TVFGPDGQLLVDAINDAMKRGRENALRVVSEEELNAIKTSAIEWRKANPGIEDVEYIRLEDFITDLSRSLSPAQRDDLMDNLKSAAQGLGETRLLGERALYLTSRFPRIVGWQIDAQISDVLQQIPSKQLLQDADRLAQATEGLQKQAPDLLGR